jgi:hypothetical protein
VKVVADDGVLILIVSAVVAVPSMALVVAIVLASDGGADDSPANGSWTVICSSFWPGKHWLWNAS